MTTPPVPEEVLARARELVREMNYKTSSGPRFPITGWPGHDAICIEIIATALASVHAESAELQRQLDAERASYNVRDRLQSIMDEAFGPLPETPADALLTILERSLFDDRRERDAALRQLGEAREALKVTRKAFVDAVALLSYARGCFARRVQPKLSFDPEVDDMVTSANAIAGTLSSTTEAPAVPQGEPR